MTQPEHDRAANRRIEQIAADLTRVDPPDALWSRIEHDLRRAATEPEEVVKRRRREARIVPWIYSIIDPRWSFAAYILLILTGVAAGVYVISVRSVTQQVMHADSTSSESLFAEAQQDIDQAIIFYERAIGKLAVLAERNEKNLDPRYVVLQKEKIASLRSAIDECKRALNENRMHPDVQQYLLTAYIDLQGALQELAGKRSL